MGFDYAYVQGYTAALQDVKDVLNYIRSDMKVHKIPFNQKNINKLMDCMIENRSILREEPYSFVRCNSDNEFEIFIADKKEVYKNV